MSPSGRRKELLLMVFWACALAVGCGTPSATPDFSSMRTIAELATLKCYYHNVAEIKNDGTDLLFGFVNIGYKRAWYEYRGSVELGIDLNKMNVSPPDSNNVVTVELPEVEIYDVQVDEDTIQEVCVDNGAFQKITNEELVAAFNTAQSEMKEEATRDPQLAQRAKEHAKGLIEEYIHTVGASVGQTYTVTFTDASPD